MIALVPDRGVEDILEPYAPLLRDLSTCFSSYVGCAVAMAESAPRDFERSEVDFVTARVAVVQSLDRLSSAMLVRERERHGRDLIGRNAW